MSDLDQLLREVADHLPNLDLQDAARKISIMLKTWNMHMARNFLRRIGLLPKGDIN